MNQSTWSCCILIISNKTKKRDSKILSSRIQKPTDVDKRSEISSGIRHYVYKYIMYTDAVYFEWRKIDERNESTGLGNQRNSLEYWEIYQFVRYILLYGLQYIESIKKSLWSKKCLIKLIVNLTTGNFQLANSESIWYINIGDINRC